MFYSPNTRGRAAAFLLSMFMICLMAFTQSRAEECEPEPDDCPGIRIWNCTDIDFDICFRLCCDGELVITQSYPAPPTGCPGGNPSLELLFPSGCTLLGVASITPQLPANVEFVFDESTCRAVIRYK